jgi:peptidoglycan hydrolase-like protein with peptidoglycan-binding domain
MSQAGARAWWADVEHLREAAERREADERATRRRHLSVAPDEPVGREAARERADGAPMRRLPERGDTSVQARRLRAAEPRRTVQITGRMDTPSVDTTRPRHRAASRRSRPAAPLAARPDRIAMWAVVLGLFLLLVAALSSDSASAATRLGDRTLKAGMVGRDVRHLQLRLKHAGVLQAPATARFGALTKRAVRSYQRSRCLHADGVAGPATIRALRANRRRCARATKGARATGRRSSGRAAYLRVQLGRRTLARGMAGRDVRTLQRLLGLPVAGRFGPVTAGAVRRFQRRTGLGVDGAVGPATRDALVRKRMRARTVTFFGPGLYGRRTACGARLTRNLRGVAHRSLPCGTPVTLFRAGRFVTVPVVDRGPYTDGITFDLTAGTARALGLATTERIRAAY